MSRLAAFAVVFLVVVYLGTTEAWRYPRRKSQKTTVAPTQAPGNSSEDDDVQAIEDMMSDIATAENNQKTSRLCRKLERIISRIEKKKCEKKKNNRKSRRCRSLKKKAKRVKKRLRGVNCNSVSAPTTLKTTWKPTTLTTESTTLSQSTWTTPKSTTTLPEPTTTTESTTVTTTTPEPIFACEASGNGRCILDGGVCDENEVSAGFLPCAAGKSCCLKTPD